MPENKPVLLEITANLERFRLGTIPMSKLNELEDFFVRANRQSDAQGAEKAEVSK
jgi:hypothetical protein